MRFSPGKVNAFYSADHEARESIRQDVLAERYADLQMEIENIENLLNISEQERDEILFDITDFLFECLEELVPELTEDDISEAPNDVEAAKQARIQKIKKREKTSIAIAKNAEKLKRAKSNIQTARLRIKGAQSPEAKGKAREGLRSARRHLATTGMKAGTAQK